MTSIFEWLFKFRPLLYERGELAFNPPWPSFATWILIIAALSISFLLYRRYAAMLSSPWRWILSGMRAASFVVIIVIFLQPRLLLHSVIPQQNYVAVAYDVSRSMEIRDGPGGASRLEQERTLLRASENPFLSELAAKFKMRFFRFSGNAESANGFEISGRRGQITSLEKALTQISGELANAPVAGIVLITDGADNHSTNLNAAIAQLRERNIPVYPIGIGAAALSRDAELLRVSIPNKVLKDSSIEAEVWIGSSGCSGEHAALMVYDGERLLQSKEIALGDNGESKVYRINFTCRSAGARALAFRLTPLHDEAIKENNERIALLQVEDEQPQILYVEGAPRWEYVFMRRAVLQDKNLHLITLLRQADGKFLRQGVESAKMLEKGFPSDRAELFKFKAIILGSVEASFFSFEQLRMIADFVSIRGGACLMLGGRSSFGQGGYANTPIEEMLPVNLGTIERGSSPFQDAEFKLQLTNYGFSHPITRMSFSEEKNRKTWEDAPTLAGFNNASSLKPGATVLARAAANKAGEAPVILAFQRYGKGKSAAFMTGSSWRWKMGRPSSDNFHELFWKQMLRWLASDAPDQVTASSDKGAYATEEPASIRVEANDFTFSPVNNARLSGSATSPSGRTHPLQFFWDVDKEGTYSASFTPDEAGLYEISAEASRDEKSLGAAKSHFLVAESKEEFHDASMNSNLLKRIASETGGRYYSPEDVSSLPEDISYSNKGPSRREEKDLWDMPFLFLLLIGFVATEWIFRKRKGLA